ncbi:MAG: hypothetical protein FWC27_15730 [Firmicutes bacterium]|nr:hypothetical protein [Bacillota bacterium]
MRHLTQTQIDCLLGGELPDAKLASAERAAMLEHTLGCAGCAALLWQANEALPEIAPPPGMEKRILERTHANPRPENLRSYALRVAAAVAAALVLLFSGAFQRLAQLDLPKLSREIQTQITELFDYAKEGLTIASESK